MSRRIVTRLSEETRGLESAVARDVIVVKKPEPDDFLGRLIKYIPTEIVALYIAVRGAVPAGQPVAISWWIAGLAWLLVPIYFWTVTRRGGEPPLVLQILLATIAFPVWVFAIGGTPLTSIPWYLAHSYIGSIVLIFVTVIFGWIEPRAGA